ncbi:DEAD/DEAH box helicase, partial [Thioclava sp. BHET1]
YKKAQRLLSGARVQAAWGPAPSADEVRARDAVRLMDAEELVAAPDEDEATLVADLLAQHGPDQLAAGFLRLWRAGRSAPEELMGEAPPADSARKSREAFGDSVWYEISVGRTGRAEPRWLLPKLCDHGRITKTEIGAIRVQENVTYVQIAAQAATGFEQALGAGMALEEGVALSRMAGEPVLE